MITTYLLKNCKHCKELLKYIKKNPNLNICLIIVSKDDIPLIKENEPRIKQFPVAFFGNPKKNGLPYKNSHIISGSSTILDTLENNFGTSGTSGPQLKGSNISIDYLDNNQGNISGINNIRKHRNNCFGNTCHVMDRPFGPTDNQYILQGYQPSCAIPLRSDLPIKYGNNSNMNNFGMTTPGTKEWQHERKPWINTRIALPYKNLDQYNNANKYAKINVPMTYKDDYLNQKIWNPLLNYNFGTQTKQNSKFISAPVNQTAPFLTYAAGSNGISRVTGKNFYPEQNPIQKSPKSAYISGNIKNYVSNNLDKQRLLAGGLDSPWSINAQGINTYGNVKKQIKRINRISRPPVPSVPSVPSVPIRSNKPFGDKNPWILTRTESGQDTNPSQYFQRHRFTKNGNAYGKPKSIKPKSIKPRKKRQMKFTSPLGIEISFN